MKVCSKCGGNKSLNAFNKNHNTGDGFDHRCKICVSRYQKERRINNPDIRKKQIEQKRVWNDKNREKKRRNDLEQKRKKQFTGRMIGTSNIGEHLRRSYDDKPDFEKEREIINRERNFILSKGNKWFTFGSRGAVKNFKKHLSYLDISLAFEKECNGCFENKVNLNILGCLYCDGFIVMPEVPKSYDYDNDGFVMPFCNDCGVVYNE